MAGSNIRCAASYRVLGPDPGVFEWFFSGVPAEMWLMPVYEVVVIERCYVAYVNAKAVQGQGLVSITLNKHAGLAA